MGFRLVDKRATRANIPSSHQAKVLLTTSGNGASHPSQDVDVFIDSMCARARQELLARREDLWNGTAQFLYQDALERTLRPKLREWDEETNGREYLEDLYRRLRD